MVVFEKDLHCLSVPDADPEIFLYFRTRVTFNFRMKTRSMSPYNRQVQEAKEHKDHAPWTITISVVKTHERRRSYDAHPFRAHDHNGVKKIPFSSRSKLNIGDEIELLDKKAEVVEWVGGSSGKRYKYFVVIKKEPCQGSLLSQGTL